MKPLNDIPIDFLRERFEYAPELGGSCLRWRQDRIAGMGQVKCKAGTMAGCLTAEPWHATYCYKVADAMIAERNKDDN